jgi:hypothetical protein
LFDEIVRKVRRAFRDGIKMGSARGYDRFKGDPRAIIQFKVNRSLYDLFFNSRTGYRAQFWRSPDMGVSANAFLVANLLAEVCDLDPWPTRDDWKLTRDLAMRSLLCVGAKVWIAEKVDDQDVRKFILDSPRLVVPQWLRNLVIAMNELAVRCHRRICAGLI